MDQLSIVTLLIWTSIFLAGLVVLVIVLVRPRSVDLSDVAERMSPLVPVLSLLFGTSVSLAGAVVTINGARLTASVLQTQQESSTSAAMRELAAEMTHTYSELAFSISSAIRAGLGILMYGEHFLEAPGQSDLGPAINDRIDVFVSSLDELDSSLQKVLFNQDTRDLLQNRRIDGALTYIGDKSTVLLPGFGDFSDFDFVSFLHFIHGSQVSLARDPVGTIRTAYCNLLLNGGKQRLRHGDLGAPEWVAFSGYLIFVAQGEPQSGGFYVYSLGLAMLHDLFHMIPDGDAISDYVVTQHGDGFVGVPVRFVPSSVLGNQFAKGMDAVSERQELVFFQGADSDTSCR